jgi:hypothetical protein
MYIGANVHKLDQLRNRRKYVQNINLIFFILLSDFFYKVNISFDSFLGHPGNQDHATFFAPRSIIVHICKLDILLSNRL